ncbi:hypothetical protein [Candidatus Palauibacter sp.]|uniref:hypothetical protein n=1 Tax=Candidatus Palauibacter sp. TaxID=3101350 RepID=UPI003B0295FA
MLTRRVRHGLVGGLLGGFVLAVLFYFYDLGQGRPLQTPAFLWGAIVSRAEVEPTVGIIAGFTVIHFAAWGALGMLAAALVRWAGLPRNVLIGALYGLFVCSLAFYAGLIRAPADLVLSAPDWPAVFFGNALAGVVMFTHMHWVSSEPGVIGVMNFLRTHEVTRHGIYAGLLGALVVAAWFLIIDSILREPFYTPAALATVLFRGAPTTASVEIAVAPILGYTLAHFAFFVLFGVAVSGLAKQAIRFPPLALGILILFVVFEVFFIAMVAMLGGWILEELAWWSILVGNVFAALVMGAYLWRAHPELAERITSERIWAD